MSLRWPDESYAPAQLVLEWHRISGTRRQSRQRANLKRKRKKTPTPLSITPSPGLTLTHASRVPIAQLSYISFLVAVGDQSTVTNVPAKICFCCELRKIPSIDLGVKFEVRSACRPWFSCEDLHVAPGGIGDVTFILPPGRILRCWGSFARAPRAFLLALDTYI